MKNITVRAIRPGAINNPGELHEIVFELGNTANVVRLTDDELAALRGALNAYRVGVVAPQINRRPSNCADRRHDHGPDGTVPGVTCPTPSAEAQMTAWLSRRGVGMTPTPGTVKRGVELDHADAMAAPVRGDDVVLTTAAGTSGVIAADDLRALAGHVDDRDGVARAFAPALDVMADAADPQTRV